MRLAYDQVGHTTSEGPKLSKPNDASRKTNSATNTVFLILKSFLRFFTASLRVVLSVVFPGHIRCVIGIPSARTRPRTSCFFPRFMHREKPKLENLVLPPQNKRLSNHKTPRQLLSQDSFSGTSEDLSQYEV